MNYTYLKDFNKTSVDDMELVQKVISESGLILDTNLFPIIEEAEKGSYAAMAELCELFMNGNTQIKPNFDLTIRYLSRLHEQNLKTNDPIVICETLYSFVDLYMKFDKQEKAKESAIKAFRYMVTNLEPQQWNKVLLQLISDNIEVYQ